MNNIVLEYIEDNERGDKYIKSISKLHKFNYSCSKANAIAMVSEIVGDVVGELWMDKGFWEKVRVGVDEDRRLDELCNLAIKIIDEKKEVIYKDESVLRLFRDVEEMRERIVEVVKDGLSWLIEDRVDE